MQFGYLIDKIRDADFQRHPFRHIEIQNFFREADFQALTKAPEIAIPQADSDARLFSLLFDAGYKIINFPGCTVDSDAYIKWHKHKRRNVNPKFNQTSCEGFGVTLRLAAPRSPHLEDLNAFMGGKEFQQCLADKFEIDLGAVFHDGGLQKYLDGYEISPHADNRKKALTYMVNLNPGASSALEDHHTHYLRFREAYKYVQAYWEGNSQFDRCWVPWAWCDIEKTQAENNSVVIFSPQNDSLHGVKACYDHLSYQRTQLYGNLWYTDHTTRPGPIWEVLAINDAAASRVTAVTRARSLIAASLRAMVRNFPLPASKTTIRNRLKQARDQANRS